LRTEYSGPLKARLNLKNFLKVGRIHGVHSYTFIMEQRSACSIVSIAQGLATVAEVNFENLFEF